MSPAPDTEMLGASLLYSEAVASLCGEFTYPAFIGSSIIKRIGVLAHWKDTRLVTTSVGTTEMNEMGWMDLVG